MKNQIIYASAFLFAALGLSACSENAWNDHLDGFESGFNYTEKITVSYTLTNSDYETIGKALAKIAVTDAEKAAASAIQSNHYFDQSSPYPAQVAIPYLLDDTSSDYYLYTNGSVAEISFRQCSSTPEEIGQISSSYTYTLTAADYQSVWGSDSDYVSSFAPSHPAANYLPNILKEEYPDAEEGDYAIVSYSSANEDPYFGDSGEVEITDNIKNLAVGDNLSAVAVVTAQSSRGLILTDKGGSIFYYNTGVDLSTYTIGTIVKVSGSVDAYNKGLQLTNAASLQVVGSEDYSYPAPIAYTPAMVDEACTIETDMQATYASIQGELSISGNYLNVIIEGAEAQGSIYYVTDELKANLVDGEAYTFYGYFMAVSGSSTKYFNLVLTEVGPYGGEVSGSYSLTDNIKDLAVGDNLSARVVVTAQCSRGAILTDNAGSILYYNTGIDLSTFAVGTILDIEGEVSAYNKGLQLSSSATYSVVATEAYGYPYPVYYTAEMIDSACEIETDMLASYVAIEGQMSVSGTYYNVIISGASSQGSLYYVTDELKEQIEDGTNYILYGYFMAVSGSSTKYFNMVVTGLVKVPSEAEAAATRAALLTPAAASENAVYYFNGSAWVVPENVAVLNAADYSEMGFADNSLSDADIYIPIYLEKAFPYALSGDEVYVAYNIKTNSASCDLFVYDGSAWTLNNNALETVTGAFTKNNGEWSFSKYIGKSIFNLFDENEIEMNRTYMFVSGDVCANPVLATNSYGYLLTTTISISGNQVVMPNENNGFKFLSVVTIDGKEVSTPEGLFVIQDSYERFLYLQGTYSSFNVRAEAPQLNDNGTIAEGYLFSATSNGDGTWKITNTREGNVRNIYYSSGYSNFAAYTDQGANDSFPQLFILAEE